MCRSCWPPWSRLDAGEVAKDVEWPTLVFFASLFVMVSALVNTGVIDEISRAAPKAGCFRSMLLLWGSALLSAVIDNIPYGLDSIGDHRDMRRWERPYASDQRVRTPIAIIFPNDHAALGLRSGNSQRHIHHRHPTGRTAIVPAEGAGLVVNPRQDREKSLWNE
ncbi:hypothetical protein GCM10022251_34740 [Phytohabitans flavus]|uniref:Citrate transporter-like domain-containing protein n=1 Tax=Phytohabitans flavus TaxID=1076124 RepID=A0A6F8XN26_9ACTN|nr:hypothetical protein Pflav_015780 [Phytohabitans flavus]